MSTLRDRGEDDEDLPTCERCQKSKPTVLVHTGFAGESELLCGDCVFEERCEIEEKLEKLETFVQVSVGSVARPAGPHEVSAHRPDSEPSADPLKEKSNKAPAMTDALAAQPAPAVMGQGRCECLYCKVIRGELHVTYTAAAESREEPHCPKCAARARVKALFERKWNKDEPEIVTVHEIQEALGGVDLRAAQQPGESPT